MTEAWNRGRSGRADKGRVRYLSSGRRRYIGTGVGAPSRRRGDEASARRRERVRFLGCSEWRDDEGREWKRELWVEKGGGL